VYTNEQIAMFEKRYAQEMAAKKAPELTQEQVAKFKARFEAEQQATEQQATEQQATEQQAPQPEVSQEYPEGAFKRDLAREAGKGLVSTIDFMGDVANYLPPIMYTRAALGKPLVTDVIPDIQDVPWVKEATTREVEKYDNAREGALTAANFLGGSVVPLSPIKKGKDALKYGAEALAFSGGAGAARGVSDESNPLLESLAGFTAATSPQLVANALRSGGNVFRQTSYDEDAAKEIAALADDSAAVAASLNGAEGTAGTLGQISGDKNLLAIENSFKNYDSAAPNAFRAGLDNVNNNIAKQTAERISGLAPKGADPQAITNVAKDRVKGLENTLSLRKERLGKRLADKKVSIESGLKQAVSAKEDAIAATVADKENVLAKTLAAQADKQARRTNQLNVDAINRANPSAAPITKTGTEGVSQLKNNIDSEYASAWAPVKQIPEKAQQAVKNIANANEASLVVPADKELVKNMVKYLDDTVANGSPEAIRNLDKAMRGAIDSASRSGNKTLSTTLDSMRNALRTGLDDGVSARLSELDSVYPEYLGVRKAAASADGAEFSADQLSKADKIVSGETLTATGRKRFSDLTNPIKQLDEFDTATTKELEAAGKQSIANTIGEGDAAIRGLNTAAANDVTAATNLADALRKSGERKVAKGLKTPVAKFAEYEDAVEGMLNVIRNKKNPVAQLDSILKTAKKGGASDSVKAAVVEAFSRAVYSGGKLSNTARDKFETLRKPLTKALGADGVTRLDDALKHSDKIKLHSESPLLALPDAGKGLKFYMASILGIKAATTVLSGNALLMGQLGKKVAVDKAVNAPHKKLLAAMQEQLLNPQKHKEILEKVRKDPSRANIHALLAEWGIKGTALAQQDEYEE